MPSSGHTDYLSLPQWLVTDHPQMPDDLNRSFAAIDAYAAERRLQTYTALDQLGLSGAVTTAQVCAAMPPCSKLVLRNTLTDANRITDAPHGLFVVSIVRPGLASDCKCTAADLDSADQRTGVYSADNVPSFGGWTAPGAEIITATNATAFAYTSVRWGSAPVTLDSIKAQKGNRLAISGGQVAIPDGITSVLASGYLGQKKAQAPSDFRASICVYRAGSAYSYYNSPAVHDISADAYTYTTGVITPVLITGLQAGDTIAMCAYGGANAGDALGVDPGMAMLTVQEV